MKVSILIFSVAILFYILYLYAHLMFWYPVHRMSLPRRWCCRVSIMNSHEATNYRLLWNWVKFTARNFVRKLTQYRISKRHCTFCHLMKYPLESSHTSVCTLPSCRCHCGTSFCSMIRGREGWCWWPLPSKSASQAFSSLLLLDDDDDEEEM